MNLDESRQEFIPHMELMIGRPLTRQEINMAILQAEQILVAANQIYNTAPKDGTVISLIQRGMLTGEAEAVRLLGAVRQ